MAYRLGSETNRKMDRHRDYTNTSRQRDLQNRQTDKQVEIQTVIKDEKIVNTNTYRQASIYSSTPCFSSSSHLIKSESAKN
jgi:hypothetical protein